MLRHSPRVRKSRFDAPFDDFNNPDQPGMVNVTRVEKPGGWVIFQVDPKQSKNPGTIPIFLHQDFTGWLERNPELTIKTVLPIVMHGRTSCIHVWYE